jgi:PleD family two-component response regulator
MTRRFGGTGLGTTIARQLTELMGGNISVTSTLGSGSCFTVRLPVQLSQQEAVVPAAHQQSVLPPLRILITDDVPENLELLELLLKPRGHQVMKAGSGQEAIALFAQHTFDVILMDVQMPEMDGLRQAECCMRWQQKLPVLYRP